ncbi:hypothetical protein Bbelb_161860 [Branchiostoma belcheri]|nr:hypothetical protein Bbelb_161860 [Branchiostoma belcheri]
MDITKAAPDRTDGGQKSPPWSDLRAVRPEIKHVHLARAYKRNEDTFVIFILLVNVTMQYSSFRQVSAGSVLMKIQRSFSVVPSRCLVIQVAKPAVGNAYVKPG